MHFHFLLSFYWCTWPLTNKVDHMYYISIFLEEKPPNILHRFSNLPNHFKTCTIMLTNVLTVKRTLHVSFVKCPYLVYFIRNLENTSTCTDKSKVLRNHTTCNKCTSAPL